MSQNQQEQSEAKLLAYIEGELDAVGRAEIEKHLEAHPQHRRLLDEMRGMRDWVRWLPRETGPPELAEGFQGKLERSVLLGPPDNASGNPMRINRWPQLRAAAAVAALAIGLGAIVFVALPSRFRPYATLPQRSSPGSDNIAVSGRPNAKALDDRLTKKTDTREIAPDLSADSVGRPSTDSDHTAIGDGLATRPANDQDKLVKDTPKDDLYRFGGQHQGAARAPVSAPPTTEPTVVNASKESAEPTAELERLARGTYKMVSADPRRFALDVHPAAVGGFGGGGGADKTKAQFIESEAAAKSLRGRNQYVMVVLSTDTDRARKQIGDYLANNGIRAQIINDGDTSALAEVTNLASKPVSDNKAPSPISAPESLSPAGPAPGSALAPASTRAERSLAGGVPPAPAPTAAPERPSAAAEPKDRAPRAAQPRSLSATAVPPASAPAAAASGASAGAKDALLAPAPSGAVASSKLGEADGAGAAVAALGSRNDSISAQESTSDILIARRMTARQARDLQANLRKPKASQWAEVYSESLPLPTSAGESSGRPRSGGQKPESLADQAQPQKLESRDAQSEAMAGRKAELLAANNAGAMGRRNASATTHAADSGQLPLGAAGPQGLPLGVATIPSAERYRMAIAAPASVAVPTTTPVGGAGARRAPADRAVNRALDEQALAQSTLFNAPATQPGEFHRLMRSVATTAPTYGTMADDQPVDIVIVLQQSPAASAAAPPTMPAAPTTRPGK